MCKEIRLHRKGGYPSWLSLFHLLAWSQEHIHGPRFIHLNRGSIILGAAGSITSEQTCVVPTWCHIFTNIQSCVPHSNLTGGHEGPPQPEWPLPLHLMSSDHPLPCAVVRILAFSSFHFSPFPEALSLSLLRYNWYLYTFKIFSIMICSTNTNVIISQQF